MKMGEIGETVPEDVAAEPPCLTSLRARAPKLIRRANGVEWLLETLSASSKGLSSTEHEEVLSLLDLPLLELNGDVWGGDPDCPPGKPAVERDSRRRCCCA